MPGSRRPPAMLLVAAFAMAALVLAGCSDDDGDTGAGATTTRAEVDGGGGADDDNAVTIDMKDYAFDVTGSVTAGTSTVVMKNTGRELHMTSFGLLRAGKTLADVQAALQSEDEAAFGAVFEKEVDSPGGLLSPGQTQEVTTPFLEAGDYALLCFIPTAGEGAPHFAKGMINTLEVAEGKAEVTPEADAEYTVEDGRIDGPTTLEAGETTMRMTSAGAGPHEFFVIRKKDAAATYQDIDKAFTDLFESETPPPVGYVDGFPAVIAASTFDVAAGTSVFLTVNLEPGDYLIGCAREPDEDEDGAKEHTGELADVKVA